MFSHYEWSPGAFSFHSAFLLGSISYSERRFLTFPLLYFWRNGFHVCIVSLAPPSAVFSPFFCVYFLVCCYGRTTVHHHILIRRVSPSLKSVILVIGKWYKLLKYNFKSPLYTYPLVQYYNTGACIYGLAVQCLTPCQFIDMWIHVSRSYEAIENTEVVFVVSKKEPEFCLTVFSPLFGVLKNKNKLAS